MSMIHLLVPKFGSIGPKSIKKKCSITDYGGLVWILKTGVREYITFVGFLYLKIDLDHYYKNKENFLY